MEEINEAGIDLEDLPNKPGNWYITWHCRKDYSEIGEWYCSISCNSRKAVTGWKNGRPHGRWIKWNKNGKMMSYVEYNLGRANGIKKEWSDDKLIIDQIWEDGLLIKDNLKEKENA